MNNPYLARARAQVEADRRAAMFLDSYAKAQADAGLDTSQAIQARDSRIASAYRLASSLTPIFIPLAPVD